MLNGETLCDFVLLQSFPASFSGGLPAGQELPLCGAHLTTIQHTCSTEREPGTGQQLCYIQQ